MKVKCEFDLGSETGFPVRVAMSDYRTETGIMCSLRIGANKSHETPLCIWADSFDVLKRLATSIEQAIEDTERSIAEKSASGTDPNLHAEVVQDEEAIA